MDSSPKLYVDVHEPRGIEDRLREAGIPLLRKAIAPGDYIVGEVGVERKTIGDFFSSIMKKRLFEQITRLRETYPKALLLVEGDLARIEHYANPKAFWGAFISLHLEEGIPVLFSPDENHTALILETLYRRQERTGREFGLRHKPKFMSVRQQQEFVVQGLPNIGDTLSRALLERFGSVRKIMAASETDLLRVPKIGEVRAALIVELLDTPYESKQGRLEEE
ncbi:MAG: ERCC4 domain-containing protein [Thermoplasmata archaeon]